MIPAWVIYSHPLDHPNHFVVRQWAMFPDKPAEPNREAFWLRESLRTARAVIPPGAVRYPRKHGDDPIIVETWI